MPRLIQKEMDQYKIHGDLDKYRLTMIKNEYFEGYMNVSLQNREKIDKDSFVLKAM